MPPSPDEAARKLAYQKPADSAYAQRIRERDKPTWTNSFYATKEDLLGVAWIRRPPGTTPEDLIQQTFLDAWGNARLFQGDSQGYSFYMWLHTILQRRIADQWRKVLGRSGNRPVETTHIEIDEEGANDDVPSSFHVPSFAGIPQGLASEVIRIIREYGIPPFTKQEVDSLDFILHNPGKSPHEFSKDERQRLYNNWNPKKNPKPPQEEFFPEWSQVKFRLLEKLWKWAEVYWDIDPKIHLN